MVGGDRSSIIVVFAAAGFGAFTAIWLLDFAIFRVDLCTVTESTSTCVREWLAATSGWFAIIAAVFTIFFLNRQILLQQALHDEDLRHRGRAIADAIGIDLLQTSNDVPKVDELSDFPRDLSLTSRELFKDAVQVAPRLAAALRWHLSEVSQFERTLTILQGLDVDAGELLGRWPEKRGQTLGFRARLLAQAFLKAANDYRDNKPPTSPFITDKQIEIAALEYDVDIKEEYFIKLLQ